MLQLKQLLNEPSWGLMKKSLQSQPQDLPSTFREYLRRLGDPCASSRARLAWKALLWLTFTRAPLSPERLQEALSIQPHSTGLDSDFVSPMSCILECCLGLVIVDGHAQAVRLVHFSLQEYLRTHIPKDYYSSGLEELALDCFTYCSFHDFSQSPCANGEGIVARLRQYPLLAYFAAHWRAHTLACSDSPRVQAALIDLLSSDPHRANLSQMFRFVGGYREHYYTAREAASIHVLHVLASLGHLEIFKKALAPHMDKVNLQTSLVGSTPIILAASAGHVEISRYLRECGADPYIPNWYGNALHCAAEANNPSTITLLLDFGMDIESRTAHGATVLCCTTDNDAAGAAAVLLSRGADPMNLHLKRHTNLLIEAVEDHCPRVVKLVLSRQCVDIEAVGGQFGLTALRTATLLLQSADIILLLAEATANAAESSLHRRVVDKLQRVPIAMHENVGAWLMELFRKEGWEGVKDKIVSILEEAEGASRFAELSVEGCEDGAGIEAA